MCSDDWPVKDKLQAVFFLLVAHAIGKYRHVCLFLWLGQLFFAELVGCMMFQCKQSEYGECQGCLTATWSRMPEAGGCYGAAPRNLWSIHVKRPVSISPGLDSGFLHLPNCSKRVAINSIDETRLARHLQRMHLPGLWWGFGLMPQAERQHLTK